MSEAKSNFPGRRYLRFFLASAAVLVALLCRQAMMQYLNVELPPFVTFYPTVMVVALVAGVWPGVLATALAVLLTGYWIFPPVGQFAIARTSDTVALYFFSGMGVFMSVVAEGYRRNLHKAAALKQELALRESNAKLKQTQYEFEALANAIPQLAWMANPDGWIFWYNERWYSYTGTTPEQMEGWGWKSVHDPSTLPAVLERWTASIATGEPFDMVFPLKGRDGVFHPFLTRVMPVKDLEGKVVRWFGTNTDIREQKQIEDELRKSNERLDLAIEVANLGEWELDLINQTSSRSLRHAQIFGYHSLHQKWSFEMFLDHVLPEYRAEVERKIRASLFNGSWDFDTRIRRVDGEVRWVWGRGRAEVNETGQPLRMFGIIMDVTERKRAEEAQARLAAIVESSADAILSKTVDGIVLSWNRSAEQLFGYSAEEAIGQPASLIIPPDRFDEEIAFLTRVRNGKHIGHYETVRVDKSGRNIEVSLTISPIRDASGAITGVSTSVRDITARKQAERALRASEERWAITLKSIGDAVISTDATGSVDFMNDVAQKLTGWPIDEAKGKDLNVVFDIVQETTRIKPESPVAKVIRLGKVVGLANHTLLVSRDGTEIPIEDSAAPIRDKKGEIEGVVLVFHDASEQRKMEKVLRNNERLATTGRLAATIAHEIHNPLDSVGNLLYLIAYGTREDSTREFASAATQELGRVTQMTQQMLAFQREAAKPVPVKIGEILDNVVALYQRKIVSAGINLKKQIDTDGDILALPGELRQAFANLLGNAIEAVGKQNGAITLRACHSRDWRSGRNGMRVVVADNGLGMPVSVRDRIFEPFFTTKGESGTGLGLWITSDIIRKYQGTIRIRTTTHGKHSGTHFSVFFPFDIEAELSEMS
jgi:PAS domain S-box-containing protein